MVKKVKKISEMAVLVDLTCGGWNGTITDDKATKTAVEQYKAKEKAGKFVKNLIDKDTLSTMSRFIPKARGIVKKYTVEWEPERRGGLRLLPTKLFDVCTGELRELINEQQETKERFCEKWDERMEEAEAYLGELFNRAEYPTVDKLRKAFYIRVDFQPVPNTGNLILDLNADAVAEIQDSIDQQMSEREASLVKDVGGRLYGVLAKMIERLTSDRNPSEKSCHATVRDLNEMADLLPALNVTGDKELEGFATELKAKLFKLDPGQLKEDKDFREDKAKEAKALLDRMAAYADLSKDDDEN